MTQKRLLGRTGFEIHPLGLGGHTYPIGQGPEDFSTPDQRASLVKTLVDSGVNYFDTTWINEVEALSDAFQRTGVGKDCIVSLQYVDALSKKKWRENLRGELETRLEIMNYTSAPLFLIGVGEEQPSYKEMVQSCQAMAKLKDEGLIQNIGISCHRLTDFPAIAKLINETDLIDYMMIRFNWKYQQAAEELFPVAVTHNVGLVAMKVFCWDCGPGQWTRRISVFEPLLESQQNVQSQSLTPAQRSLIWTLRNSPCAVAVTAMNSAWEVTQNLVAIDFLDEAVDTSDFGAYADRLWSKEQLELILEKSQSKTIRDRAQTLLSALEN